MIALFCKLNNKKYISVSNKLNWRDIGPKGNNSGTQHRHPRAFVAQKDD